MNSAAPSRSYSADLIMRSAALQPGQRVTTLVPASEVYAKDSVAPYLVSDQKDKKGNPMLVNLDNGTAVFADPNTVWTIW